MPNLEIGLASLTGKASFTSLEVLSGGDRDIFGKGSLHYPIAVADNTIRDDAPGRIAHGRVLRPATRRDRGDARRLEGPASSRVSVRGTTIDRTAATWLAAPISWEA